MRRAATLAALSALVLAAPAAAEMQTASHGDIRAQLSYKTHPDRSPTNLVLRVFSGAERIVEKRIPDEEFLVPAGEDAVQVLDLDGDGVPEALFDLYTGGAHCCVVTTVFRGTTEIERNWGNVGYRFKDVDRDGVKEFYSADDRFAYRYGSYAGSLYPLQVMRLVGDEFVDITATERALRPRLKREARRYKRIYRKYARRVRREPTVREVIRSSLAAYTADQCSLGDCRKGYALVAKAQQRGAISGFARVVRRDMRKLGYDG